MNQSTEDYDFEAAAIARAGEFAKLDVPVSDEELSQEFIQKWIKPFYLTNLVYRYEQFEASYREIASEIDDYLVAKLLAQRNWRCKIVAAYFVAIKNWEQHSNQIGKLLLRSDVCYAGGGYALALARINTPQAHDYLSKYLHHYLNRPDLGFDQADVLGAVRYCDTKNQTNNLDEFKPMWAEFCEIRNQRHFPNDADQQTAQDWESLNWFNKKMASIERLANI